MLRSTGENTAIRLRRRQLPLLIVCIVLACDDEKRGAAIGSASSISIEPLSASQLPDISESPGELLGRRAEATGVFQELRIRPGTPEGSRHLYGGWSNAETSGPGDPWIWSLGASSSIRFTMDAPAALALFLRCVPFLVSDGQPQRIHVRVNDHYLSAVVLKREPSEYTVQVPAAVLRTGNNHIEFRYDWTKVPARVAPHSRDFRTLAVSFAEISLRRGHSPNSWTPTPVSVRSAAHKTPLKAVLQEGPGSLSYLIWPPRGAELEVGWLALGPLLSLRSDVQFQVAIEWDEGQKVLWRGSLGEFGRPYSKRFALPLVDRALRVRFTVPTLPKGIRWLWVRPRVLAPQGAPEAPANPLPEDRRVTNVVLLLLDAAARNRFGIYGHDGDTTPQIDALAQESLVFESAFTHASFTLPSIASLFTSLLPAEHGTLRKHDRLPQGIPTLAEVLRDAGYATVAISAHPYASTAFGTLRGFDEKLELFRGLSAGDVARPEQVHDAVEKWLRGHRGRPFFAYLHYVQPHEPYNLAPARFYRGSGQDYQGPFDGSQEQMRRVFRREIFPGIADARHLRELYDGNLRYADWAVGRLIGLLRELDLLERSLVIVTSDHGESLGERGSFGHAETVDAELIWIPLIMRLPSAQQRVGRVADQVGLIDLMPSILHSVGLEPPSAARGKNFLAPSPSAEWPRSIVSIARGKSWAVSVVSPGFKYSLEHATGKELLVALPEQQHGKNLRWKHPVTFAYLASEAQRLTEPQTESRSR